MRNPEGFNIASVLIDPISRLPDAALVGDAVDETWRGIDSALSPVLGKRGVAALHHRSLRVAGAAYPWLNRKHDGPPIASEIASLKSVVMRRSTEDALAGSAALFRAFCELLTSLIGPSLAARLLQPLVTDASSEPNQPGPTE